MDSIATDVNFLGVFACNQLPTGDFYKLPACAIINTDPSTMPGAHWLAIYMMEDGTAAFFDSFGVPPMSEIFPPSIYSFLQKNCPRIQYSNRQVQDFTSDKCGQHCIFFLYHMQKKCNYHGVMAKYSHNLVRNDTLVYNFVQKLKNCASCTYTRSYGCVQCVQNGSVLFK